MDLHNCAFKSYCTSAGFHWLEGYNKVADNSMVNWLPTLAGVYYENVPQQIGVSMQFDSDIKTSRINIDAIPFLYKHMHSRNHLCLGITHHLNRQHYIVE
jgi:hypothetical protein